MPGAPPCWVGRVGETSDISLSLTVAAECPDQSPELQPWNPGHDQDHRVYIGRGRTLLLSSSAVVHSIHISEGGKPASPLGPCRWSAGRHHLGWTEHRSRALGPRQRIYWFEITMGSEPLGVARPRSSGRDRSLAEQTLPGAEISG